MKEGINRISEGNREKISEEIPGRDFYKTPGRICEGISEEFSREIPGQISFDKSLIPTLCFACPEVQKNGKVSKKLFIYTFSCLFLYL